MKGAPVSAFHSSRFNPDIDWGGDPDRLIYERWVREGNWVKTLVIQKETGLPHARQAKIVSAEDSCDEGGNKLRVNQRIEILNLVSASPDLLFAAKAALAFIESHYPGGSVAVKEEDKERILDSLSAAIKKAKGIVT
jgi:hypothetical protein